MFKEIAVYCDSGVDPDSLKYTIRSLQRELQPREYVIRRIRAKEVIQGDWRSRSRAFMMPGGRDIFYLKALAGKGAEQIRSFVEEGGVYLGICAGAYFASGAIEFEKGGDLEVCGARPLKFFPGLASGPTYGNGKYSIQGHSGVEAASISWKNGACYTYFNGGCSFEEYPDIKILSRYEDIENQPPAIIQSSFGKGTAILSGVHLEYSTQFFSPSNPDLERVFPRLKKDEHQRKKIFCSLLSHLHLKTS